MIKIGVAPFHNWILTVIEGLDFNTILILLTINKIAPITLLRYTINSIIIVIYITISLGAILGLNQNSIKKLIGYSSIFNIGLILSVVKLNLIWTFYLIVYSIILIIIIYLLKIKRIKLVNQIIFINSVIMSNTMWINLLSIGGIPPLIGFSIKYIVIIYLIVFKLNIMIFLIVISSLLVLFFYLRISFVSSINNFITSKNKLFSLKEISIWIITVNTIFIPIILIGKIY